MSGGVEINIFHPIESIQKGGHAAVETVNIPILWLPNELNLMSGPRTMHSRPSKWLKKPRQVIRRLFIDWWTISNRRSIA